MLKKFLAVMAFLYAGLSFAAVDVNKGTAAELDGVKGIGPAMSGKIIDERKKGSFKDWNDFIERVKGIGEGNAAKLSAEGLTVNGSAYKGAAPAAKKDDKKADAKAKADDKKPESKKPEPKAKADDKKADAKVKADDKKADDKKADAKAKPAEKKADAKDEKKAKAEGDKKDAKAADKKDDKKDAKASDKK